MTRGFTLLEIVLSVGLLFLLVTMSTLTSNVYFRARHVRSAADTVASEIERAQSASLTQSGDAAHGVLVLTGSVVRFTGDTYAARTQSLDVVTEFPVAVDVSGTNEIDIPTGAYGPASDATVTISSDGITYGITITSYGVITITDGTIGY